MPNCPVCKESRYKKKTKAGKLVAKKIPLLKKLKNYGRSLHERRARGTHFQWKAATLRDQSMISQLEVVVWVEWARLQYACPLLSVYSLGSWSMALSKHLNTISMFMHIEKERAAGLTGIPCYERQTNDTVKEGKIVEPLKVRKELWFYCEGYVVRRRHYPFCARNLKDDVETRFNRLGRNDDGLPEEEPNKFQVFRSACKLTGRMKATRLTTDVRQAVVWFVLNNSPEVDADILAYREYIREKKVNDGCSEELFSLACGPISTCTYPACIVNGVKFVVHERDIFHTTQCSGVSTLGLDGEMYYGQLEEILELTYIGNRKVVLFRCKWFDTINPKNLTTHNRVYNCTMDTTILTDREFLKNNQYLLATTVNTYSTLTTLLTTTWLEGSSNMFISRRGRVDLMFIPRSGRPHINDDNANANEDQCEDDDVCHMACVFPRSHGGDAGGSPPRRPNRPVPAQCESSNLRIETGNASLRRAFRQNDQRPLTIGFDYGDLGTFHPTGGFASMLNSLMGETVRYLPLACEWEEIPEAYKAHIFPTLEVLIVYFTSILTVIDVWICVLCLNCKLGLQLKLRILWRKNKQRIKADHFTRYGSAEEARNHLPPNKVWGDRTEDEWNNLVDWWSHPDRVARSLQNAANRAKNTILTHQGKKSFAQGRNEYKVQKGHYEDLIETWRKTHSRPETGEFKGRKNRRRYLDMKSMQDQVRVGVIPYKTDQDILDEVVPSTNRQNMSGKGRKLPGGGSTSRRRGPQAFPDAISREELDRILRQKDQEAELLRKQTAEAQQRAYLLHVGCAALPKSESMYEHRMCFGIGHYFLIQESDGSSKNYKVLSEMLEDFDRMDVEELFRLVKERYSTSAPEGFDLMLWGDLHTLFEHDEDDEIWRDQHEYNI
ncbi:Myc-type, basic helix-loop-helix domain-containing protein [Tanacetum coccineum]